jgi:FKBP-type peptidyl-prolyl cis-trans isomerase FklB
MKSQLYLVTVLGLALASCSRAEEAPASSSSPAPAQSSPQTASAPLKTASETNGYAVGMSYGAGLANSFKRDDMDIDNDAMIRGFAAGVTGQNALITTNQQSEILKALNLQLTAKREEKRKEAAEKAKQETEVNRKAGEDFLAKNKSAPGVITLPDGLQYKIITNGTGPMPKGQDTVSVHYRGTFINGTEFDDSAKHSTNGLATFGVKQVIAGWTEALEMMKVGSKWQLFIPAQLAYGEGGRPGIPPGATLLFDIELVSLTPGPVEAEAGQIIAVPGTAEAARGEKPHVMTDQEIEKEKAKEATKGTNSPAAQK